jgi:hypothetical protein
MRAAPTGKSEKKTTKNPDKPVSARDGKQLIAKNL